MVSRFPVPFGSGRSLFGRSDPFLDLHREVNRLFDDALRGAPGGAEAGGGSLMMAPVMDVHDRDDAIEISAELPGVSQDDIDLRIEGDMLTLRGEKRNERKDAQAHLIERSYGSFQRSIQLPFSPNATEVKASFSDGVLTITLPKTAQKEKSQRIEVRSGQGSQQMIEGSFSSTQSGSANLEQAEGSTGSSPASGGENGPAGGSQGGPNNSAGQPQGTQGSA